MPRHAHFNSAINSIRSQCAVRSHSVNLAPAIRLLGRDSLGGTVPTNLECAIARKLESEKEEQFAETLMLLCVVLCLVNVLLIFEYPGFAAAVICSAR